MVASIPRIDYPEIFIGFVGPVGVDIQNCVNIFTRYFQNQSYKVIEIKVTSIFNILSQYVRPQLGIDTTSTQKRYLSYIAYGNQLRSYLNDDSALAALTIPRIMRRRFKQHDPVPEKTVYLIHQFKRKEEIDLFRSIYSKLFFQISIYSRRGARVDYLASKFAHDDHSAIAAPYRAASEELVQKDENEANEQHGQRVSSVFHDGDVILNVDSSDQSVEQQVTRFCDLLFGANNISPSKFEYGMFFAKAAALRTLDFSRQVGAAVFSPNGEIIALGSNEVPKALGGTYWCDDRFDDRDYKRKFDYNEKRKHELLRELFSIIGVDDVEGLAKRKDVLDSQFMDALEYGRVIHAEMSAICDASRLGRPLKDATLFCTTFPCHMCAKHIVAAGINTVVFLEPYPKSLTADLHSDSVCIEGADRGRYQEFPSVEFIHFFGISPRRYREIFERSRRKKDGEFQPWKDGIKRPIIDSKFPFYSRLEQAVLEGTVKSYLDKIGVGQSIFDSP